jgi:hypothetical protein
LGQEHRHVQLAKISYKNAFFSHYCLRQLLEPELFYTAVDVSFKLLSKLLFFKLAPVELIVPGICEANIIWLQFHQAFPRLAQHSVYCISCLRKTQLNTLFSTIKIVDEAEIRTPGYLRQNLLLHDL